MPRSRPRNVGWTRARSRSPEPIRCVTPEVKEDPPKTGIVSGGQTQTEIDKAMGDAIPVTQGKRPIPVQFRAATIKKL